MILVNKIKAWYSGLMGYKDNRLEHLSSRLGVNLTSIPTQQCPCCKHKLDVATKRSGDGDKPKTKDIGVCFSCGGILEVYKDGSLIPISEESWNSMPMHVKEQTLKASKLASEMWKPQQKDKQDLEEMFVL